MSLHVKISISAVKFAPVGAPFNTYRDVLLNGVRIGEVSKTRARFGGHHHPVRTAYRFEFVGSPTRDPIVRPTLKEVKEALEQYYTVWRAVLALRRGVGLMTLYCVRIYDGRYVVSPALFASPAQQVTYYLRACKVADYLNVRLARLARASAVTIGAK